MSDRRTVASTVGRWALGSLFIAAGVLHFLIPGAYLAVMTPWLPSPRALVLVSGGFEVLGGLGVLFPPPLRRWAGWGLAALLVAVFPVNIHMAVEGIGLSGTLGRLLLWLRLPVQLVLIAWALRASGAWPRRRGRSPGTPPPR